jgi:REP element-mobilizing transposase RayT
MPDHVHLLFQPRGKADYSEIMRSVKTNFSRDANDIILNRVGRFPFPSAGDVAPRRLRAYEQHYLHVVKPLHERFITKHGCRHDIPKFQWQSSFRDHVIRDEDDYFNHLEYIYNNAVKHALVTDPEKYPFMWIVGMKHPFAPD